eukprot:NODE_161_length_16629_cov_0.427344.p4 type:complete len:394 gc:universal NODE_161_length_16629_cov_0.427344:13873-15054(+)
MSSPTALQPDLSTPQEQELYSELIQIYNQLKHDYSNIDFLLTQFYSIYNRFLSLPQDDLSKSRQLLQSTSLDKLFDTCQSVILDILSIQNKIDKGLLPLYNNLLAIEQKLEYFVCSSSFLLEEIEQIQSRLKMIEDSYVVNGIFQIYPNESSETSDIVKGQALLTGKLNRCYQLAHRALLINENINLNLIPVYEELVEIHKTLKQENTPLLIKLKNRLNSIDNKRINGIFMFENEIYPGQAILTNLLEECYELVYEKESVNIQDLDESHKIAPPLLPLYNELVQLLAILKNLFKNERWLIRPSDLIPYQSQLGNIESKAVNNIFYGTAVNSSVSSIPQGQATIHHLLHKCHNIIYKLITDLDPIMDPELQNAHSQLLAVRKCLLEMKKFTDYT